MSGRAVADAEDQALDGDVVGGRERSRHGHVRDRADDREAGEARREGRGAQPRAEDARVVRGGKESFAAGRVGRAYTRGRACARGDEVGRWCALVRARESESDGVVRRVRKGW